MCTSVCVCLCVTKRERTRDLNVIPPGQVVPLAGGVVQSGWTMCSVREKRRGCGSVPTRGGECTTVTTLRMQASAVQVSLSVCPPVHLSVCLSVRLSVHMSVCPSICPSVCLSVRPSIRLSVCLSVLRLPILSCTGS